MPHLQYLGQSISVDVGQSVLEALTHSGQEINNNCRIGSCRSCLLKAAPGPDLSSWQLGLSGEEKSSRLFFSCLAKPKEDMEILPPDANIAAPSHEISLESITRLTEGILELRFEKKKPYDFVPGQYGLLKAPDGTERPYSFASLPDQGVITFHIRLLENGKMSHYLKEKASVGDQFSLSDPLGYCPFPPNPRSETILLICTGTGLAPIWAILKALNEKGDTRQTHLFHGSSYQKGLYHQERLLKLDSELPFFHYHPCLSSEEAEGHLKGRAHEIALSQEWNFAQSSFYLCGHPEMVKSAKKTAFLKGAVLTNIFADPFVISGT